MAAFVGTRSRFGRGTKLQSQPVRSVTFGTPYKYNTNYPTKYAQADVWYNTWADDDEIYAACGDFIAGWSGVAPTSYYTAFSKFNGFSNSLTGSSIATLRSMGVAGEYGSDGATYNFKPTGLICIAGTLYMFVARHFYGTAGSNWVQTSKDAQILKSSDHGVTWTPLPPGNAQPYASPQFSGFAFGAPTFISYGKDYKGELPDNADAFVYAISPDGVWNNGNQAILGRCPAERMSALSGADWQYFSGGDGLAVGSWVSSAAGAQPLIADPKKVSMTAVQWLPYCRRYVMLQWYYTSLTSAPYTLDTTSTIWDVYEAPAPWGPWTKIQSSALAVGLYSPVIIQKSLSTDGGQSVQIAASGDYNSQNAATGHYGLTLVSAVFAN